MNNYIYILSVNEQLVSSHFLLTRLHYINIENILHYNSLMPSAKKINHTVYGFKL